MILEEFNNVNLFGFIEELSDIESAMDSKSDLAVSYRIAIGYFKELRGATCDSIDGDAIMESDKVRFLLGFLTRYVISNCGMIGDSGVRYLKELSDLLLDVGEEGVLRSAIRVL